MATCVVSGVLQDSSGTAISGAIVRCRVLTPVFTSTIMIMPTEPTTQTTDASGAWSQTLVQGLHVEVTIEWPFSSLSSNVKSTYAIIVPATSTANFSTLTTES